MAANFESGVTFGEKSWHGQENNLSAEDARRFSVEETIDAAGMNWRVTKVPLAIALPRPAVLDGKGNIVTPADNHSADLAGTMASGIYGIFRTDRWEAIGTAGPDYQCLQNREIFEQFQPFLDCRQLSFESAGSLDGGRKVYVQARLAEEDADVGNGDKVSPMLLIASSHDGSLATRIGFTPIRVVCQNTLSAAISGGASKLLKVRHTKTQKEAITEVMKTVDIARKEFVANVEQYRRLRELKINERDLVRYVKQVLGMDTEKTRDQFSTRILNQYDRIFTLAIHGKGQSGSVNDLTAWNAYNGVTEWTSHFRQKEAEDRQKSVWFGASEKTNREALQLALSLAS